MPESFPTTFGRYTLIERLGMGGMAEVFLAEVAGPASFTKRVVVKRLLPELTEDREVVARFLEEARLSAKFAHPNVVQVFELGDVDGDYYIAMEYVAGADLRRIERLLWPSRAEVPIGIAAAVVGAVCRALDHVHSLTENGTPLGIVHRDVSPSNVLLSFEGGVKLIDFGVARAHAHARITRHGTAIMGKLVYASPEQVLGLPVTPRSDLFSVGCLLYEALTSVRPFERDSEPATLHAITRETARPPSELRSNLPKALDDVVLRALARNPGERWPTAGQMAQALEAFVAERGQLIGTPQLGAFVRAALEDQDALTVTRMGDPRLERELRGRTPGAAQQPITREEAAPEDDDEPVAPAGLEEFPTLVETGVEPVESAKGGVPAARRASSLRRAPLIPGPSDWDVPESDGAVEPVEDLPTMVQGAGSTEPPAPERPRSMAAPPGLEEFSTAVVPPESVAALAASMDTMTPGVAPPSSRPIFGIPEGMPSDTVIEGADGVPTATRPPDDEHEERAADDEEPEGWGDLPAEPTRIDASHPVGVAPRAIPVDEHEDLSTLPPPRASRLAPRAPTFDEEEAEEAATGAGTVPSSAAQERLRMAYAQTMAAPAFSVQPGGEVVVSSDRSSAVATYGLAPAAAVLMEAEMSTVAPDARAALVESTSDSSIIETFAAPDPGLQAIVPRGRPIPIAFLAIAGAVAVLTAVLVAVALSGDDEPAPIPPMIHAVPLGPHPVGEGVRGTPPVAAPPTAPATGPAAPPAPAPAPTPSVASTHPTKAPEVEPAPAPAKTRAGDGVPAQGLTGRTPAKRRDMGRLRLTSSPRGSVEIDGTRAGMTPLIGYPLTSGSHRIRIVSERTGRSASIAVKIRAGHVITRNVRLRRNPTMPRR